MLTKEILGITKRKWKCSTSTWPKKELRMWYTALSNVPN